jgi:hypothetical protein
MLNMRNLLEYPITAEEVIRHLNEQVTLEKIMAEAMPQCGSMDVSLSEVALAVVKAAAVIVQNDIGSTAADLLAQAFQSQNIRVKEVA